MTVLEAGLLKSFHDHIGIAMLQRVGQPFRRYIIQRGWNFFRSRPVIAVHYRCGHCCHDLSRVFICASLDNAMCGWPRSVPEADLKSVVEGTSVAVRVDLGGGRLIKKK